MRVGLLMNMEDIYFDYLIKKLTRMLEKINVVRTFKTLLFAL